jgi:D-alanyl-D-alanine carboxypeptidase
MLKEVRKMKKATAFILVVMPAVLCSSIKVKSIFAVTENSKSNVRLGQEDSRKFVTMRYTVDAAVNGIKDSNIHSNIHNTAYSNADQTTYEKADNDVDKSIYNQVIERQHREMYEDMINSQPQRPAVSAAGAVLMDASTGKILYSKNMSNPYPPASTTKIMTALLALERCKLTDIVVVGDKPPKADGNNIALFTGEEFTVNDLLHAVIIESANDCSNALAEHISGSVENFAVEMNKRARELGCRSTNFTNPSGLYNYKHKTSAKDLALIMRELLKHPEFKAIATKMQYTIPVTNKTPRERVINNHNRLLIKNSGFYYEGCDGGKTGYTIQSKHSYVAAATKNGRQLIVALVYDENKKYYTDTIRLFNYGFSLP